MRQRQPKPGPTPNTIIPVERCPDCKTFAHCNVQAPPLPKYSSGYTCSNCGYNRWGGVTSCSGPFPVGYSYSDGAICWRCARDVYGGPYPTVPYLHGPIGVITTNDKPLDRYCDDCGNLINNDS